MHLHSRRYWIHTSHLSFLKIFSRKHNSQFLVWRPIGNPSRVKSCLGSSKIWQVLQAVFHNLFIWQTITFMMTSSNGNIFRVTDHLCGEFTGPRWIPRTKASDAELWCFSLTCAWIHDWVNNREAGDLRPYRAHYDVIVMYLTQMSVDVIGSTVAPTGDKSFMQPIMTYSHWYPGLQIESKFDSKW